MENIFNQSPKGEYKLIPLRILTFLYPSRAYSMTVNDICLHLEMFGYENTVSLEILNSMIESRFLIAETQEDLKMIDFNKACGEKIRLTKIGIGVKDRSLSLGYIQTQMYFSVCNEKYYSGYNNPNPDLKDTLKIVRMFLKELVAIEKGELEHMKNKGKLLEYNRVYSKTTICCLMYENLISVIRKIIKATSTKTSTGLDTCIDDYRSDYNVLAKHLIDKFDFNPTELHEMLEVTS